MPFSLDLTALTSRPESTSTLVRFEDDTDRHAPRLNYAVPTVSAYGGRRFVEVNLADGFWRDTATRPVAPPPVAAAPANTEVRPVESTGGRRENLDHVGGYAGTIEQGGVVIGWITPSGVLSYVGGAPQDPSGVVLIIGGQSLPLSAVEEQKRAGRVLVLQRTFDGSWTWSWAGDPNLVTEPNPRFIVIEHYRISSLFGDYGAGRTIKTFSLWPGEETRLYVRSWKRTEALAAGAASIFDSYTSEAAQAFESTVATEISTKSSETSSSHWKAKASAGLDLGFVSIGGGGGGGGTAGSSREELAKAISKAASHHSSSASARRETTITSEYAASTAAEAESVVERHVRNTNLSRVLNIVCRELNQEFTTWLSLVDVTVAFVNDRGVYAEMPLSQLDDLVGRYVFSTVAPNAGGYTWSAIATEVILGIVRRVVDYRGHVKNPLEKVTEQGRSYHRFRFPTDPSRGNPFYPNEDVPVPGIVIGKSTHTLRTDAILMDALLGHGIALDNYTLGMQQEDLRKRQLENQRMELALKIISTGDEDKARAWRTLFGSEPGAE